MGLFVSSNPMGFKRLGRRFFLQVSTFVRTMWVGQMVMPLERTCIFLAFKKFLLPKRLKWIIMCTVLKILCLEMVNVSIRNTCRSIDWWNIWLCTKTMEIPPFDGFLDFFLFFFPFQFKFPMHSMWWEERLLVPGLESPKSSGESILLGIPSLGYEMSGY